MQQAAMETGVSVVLVVSEIRPFALTPSLYGGTLSPVGISHTTSALSFNPRPTHSRRASGLAFLNKGCPHTPAERVRGHHPSRDTLSLFGRVIPKEKILVLILTEKEKKPKTFLSFCFKLSFKAMKTKLFLVKSLLFECLMGTWLTWNITSAPPNTFPVLIPKLQRLAAPSHDCWMWRQKERESPVVSIRGSQLCLLPPQALKESLGPHQSASTFHNSWQRDSTLSVADGFASGCPRQAPIV